MLQFNYNIKFANFFTIFQNSELLKIKITIWLQFNYKLNSSIINHFSKRRKIGSTSQIHIIFQNLDIQIIWNCRTEKSNFEK